MPPETPASRDFIRAIIAADLAAGTHGGRVATRFPPEPNGYLHIGHAKSINLNFGIAREFGGVCYLRFDDTNPVKEEEEYVRSIIEDVRWLGGAWEGEVRYASDYFHQMHDWALQLVRQGQAYVCDCTAEEVREGRGTLNAPGKPCAHRERSPADNEALFARMRAGEFPDGARTLRARIDMASPNVNLRDPVMYRILHARHHRTGDQWCIYPMYDWAHGLEDAIERITHSICTLEFENHRPLYDWFLEALKLPERPHQYEFARLQLSHTVMSKRLLLQLVREGRVRGWDDPRLPTVSGLRRRGYTPESLRAFCERIGVAKFNSTIEMGWLEQALREDLEFRAERRLAVFDPLKLVITDWPAGRTDELEAPNHPDRPELGRRRLSFGREIWVEGDDFREVAPKKWHRLAPGQEVRLRYAYYVTPREVIKDAQGRVVELRCTHDPTSRGGDSPDGRRVRGTIHWVDAAQARELETRIYEPLFTVDNPGQDGADFLQQINPESLVVRRILAEPSLAEAAPGSRYQFERLGYFHADPQDSRPGAPVFNRIVALRDSWAKQEGRT